MIFVAQKKVDSCFFVGHIFTAYFAPNPFSSSKQAVSQALFCEMVDFSLTKIYFFARFILYLRVLKLEETKWEPGPRENAEINLHFF